MSSKSKQHALIVLTIIISAVIMRLVPHLPNFAPVTASALFAAAFLPKKYMLLVPLLSAAIGDYLILYISPFSQQIFDFSHLQPLSAMFNPTTAFVWGSFMISALIGLRLREKRGAVRIAGASLASSLQFFLVTNFGVWAAGAYARNISGIGESYIAGLPFLRWTILGDLIYTASFFGIYALVTRQIEQEAKAKANQKLAASPA